MTDKKKNFRYKSAASFLILLSFITLASSGVALYLRPEGSIARWTSWTLLGINKQGWEGIHTFFSVLFIVSASIHVYFNWKVLISYLKDKISIGFRLKREFAAAAAITVLVLVLSIKQVEPFWKIMDWRASIKKGSNIVQIKPPLQDTDKMSLSEIAIVMNIPLSEVVRHIKEDGYSIRDTTITLQQLAELNNVSPEQLYLDIADR